jgi:predicted phosphodiesterase
MKLGLASDLHLDFADINPEFYKWRGDVLLLAGDLAEDDYLRKHCHEFFDKVSLMADYVLVISGNHEYYRSELDTADGHLDLFFEQWKNIIPLRNRSIQVGHLDIFGATMWTDFHGSPIAEFHAMQNLNDYNHIRMKRKAYGKINARDVMTEHQRGYNALLNWLETDTGGYKLVMTHHAPSMQSIPNRYKNDYELNKAYCNHFESLIENHPEISAWVHGHTHDYFDYEIGQTRIMCNPRGYPMERPADLPPYQPMDLFL